MSKYTFRNFTDEETENHKISGCEQWIFSGEEYEQYALFFGKLIMLFGINDSAENEYIMYSYRITAENEDGKKFYFEIYQQDEFDGPTISCGMSSEYEQVARKLIEFIESAEPADYVHEWKNLRSSPFCTDDIVYTVKNGVADVRRNTVKGYN